MKRRQNLKLSLAHILLKHQYEAEDVQKKLKQGDAFNTLARKFSHCPSAPLGGDLGLIDLRRLDPTFAEAAALLTPDEISPIVRTPFGYHLIKRLS